MYIIVFVTAKNAAEANKIATALVAGKLAACANIINGVRSVFTWMGKTDRAEETLLVIKSRKTCFPKIAAMVKKLHSYDVPEIIAMPIVAGSEDYLKWIGENCG
jgi:periplasmic divalent cation tolerance protein